MTRCALHDIVCCVHGCGVELYWIPVGAGTSRFQRASLRIWETIEAARARRPRATLLHSALKLRIDETATHTLEITPAFIGGPVPPLATGPVGMRGAGRFTLFRYQLQCIPGDSLPDEQWAVDSPVALATDGDSARRVLDLAPRIPTYVWGRRVRGTTEMWTSDSTIAWLLVKSGFDLAGVTPPPGGRAPGWFAGLEVAQRKAASTQRHLE